MSDLDPRVVEKLRSTYDTLMRNGDLLSEERLKAGYDAFRFRFSPERLQSLDGPALLQLMHTHGNKESLVYWLEFKNDEEFPGISFGSIAGGSAHKFGIFRRKDTDQWVKGGSRSEENITEAEAVTIARTHRDQLLAGVAALQELQPHANDAQYLGLQKRLDQQASEISSLAWAHKYWCLLFPEKLDDYHNERWQRHHLIKLLQLPPAEGGLYVCAGRFVRIAAELGWPISHLTGVLNECNGNRPQRYWRIGTSLGGTESIWQAMRDGSYVAIGWSKIGDLSPLVGDKECKEKIVKLLDEHYPNTASAQSRKAGEIRNYLTEIAEDNIVLAADGERILGVGRVKGPYRWESTPPEGAPHRRLVDWISFEPWNLPVSEGLRTAVYGLKKHDNNLLEIERRILGAPIATPPAPQPVTARVSPAPTPSMVHYLEGIPGRIQNILERKGQAILYGPPGTGKTYWARKAAFDLAAISAFSRLFVDLSPDEKKQVVGDSETPGLIRFSTFHPAYGYEDFLEGYRPMAKADGQLIFQLRAGIFKGICEDALKSPEKSHFLLIDEINRGDIPRIFGELLTLLELDKRGHVVTLPLSGTGFSVPSNVYVLGTMNTADRSIALLDTALRRRFGFVELMPNDRIFAGIMVGGSIPLGPWFNALNDRIREHVGRDGRNLQIGHAYLLEKEKPVSDFSHFVRILADDIIPLLEEYCYEDYTVLTRILGEGLVDERRMRIREELFVPMRREDLIQALLAPSPEIMTSVEATISANLPESEEAPEAEETDA